MVKIENKTVYLVDVINEIQERLNEANLPVRVKVDFGEALEGADIGLTVYVNGNDEWKLTKEISSIILDVLDEYDLIPYIDWKYVGA